MTTESMEGTVGHLIVRLAAISRDMVSNPVRRDGDRDAWMHLGSAYRLGERWYDAAIAVGIAAQTQEVTAEMRALLASALEGTWILDEMHAALDYHCNPELSHWLSDFYEFIGGDCRKNLEEHHWEWMCRMRSALGFVRELLAGHDDLLEELDMESIDWVMAEWHWALYTPQVLPSGMPPAHWWWCADGTPVRVSDGP
ncbi:MAG: hypothetical protein U0324_38365 [Polyangiales bacterium]